MHPIDLPLARIVVRRFGPTGRYEPRLRRFVADLAARQGRPAGPGLLDAPRITFTDMLAAVRHDLTGDGAPVGALVLAGATPDSEPTWPACYLAAQLPGEPVACSVADQGGVAPFTALRVAGALLRGTPARRAVVVALDQCLVPGAPGLAGNRLVALVLDEGGRLGRLRVGLWPGADPDAFLSTVDDPAATALGPGFHGRAVPAGTAAPPEPGWPATGPWAWLAGRRGPALLADYDPATGCLGACRVSG